MHRVASWIAVAAVTSTLVCGVGACSSNGPTSPSSDDGPKPGATSPSPTSSASPPNETSDASISHPTGDASSPGACLITATDGPLLPLAQAGAADEYALTVEAASASATSWSESGNEALVLDVMRDSTLVGNLVLHQGQDRFSYSMHVGALPAGEVLSVRVSALSAASATKSACISKVTLTSGASMGAAAEGMIHAPIVKWPKNKSFDDLPVLLGWSKSQKNYQLTYTNENGGTTALCGGGARGVRSEIARWGRALDMEGVYGYGDTPTSGHFERCTGVVAPAPDLPRMDALHPVLYYGDGHNRIFESRGGYGQACGTGSDAKADGDIEGWNVDNPGNDASADDPFVIVLRPLPVDMDAVGVTQFGGRREAIVDTYAPWLYRLTDSELARENKIDNVMTFPMSRYLMVDVYAMDVGGSGDNTCGPISATPSIDAHASGGFVLRATSTGAIVSNGPQMTADYFGGENNVKRIAIPLAAGVTAKDITDFTFDAYDDDGIYFMAIGDAFIAVPSGSNNATLTYMHKGKTSFGEYVDDDSSGCSAGMSTAASGVAYPCVGSLYQFNP